LIGGRVLGAEQRKRASSWWLSTEAHTTPRRCPCSRSRRCRRWRCCHRTAPTCPRSPEIAAHQKVQMGTGSEMRGKKGGESRPRRCHAPGEGRSASHGGRGAGATAATMLKRGAVERGVKHRRSSGTPAIAFLLPLPPTRWVRHSHRSASR
jgi:hypothetical protein